MIKLISFDFDGTLADSVDFCLEVFDIVFKKYMKENAPSREDIFGCFGMNEEGVLRHFMGEDYREEYMKEFARYHNELHGKKCPEVFPCIRELLDFLKEKGVILTILTGRSEMTANISLEYLKIKDYFSFVQTGTAESNDKSSLLKELLKKYSLKEEEVFYIGDGVSDVLSSRKAGIECLSAAWAESARMGALKEVNGSLLFTSVEDMQDFLEEKLGK